MVEDVRNVVQQFDAATSIKPRSILRQPGSAKQGTRRVAYCPTVLFPGTIEYNIGSPASSISGDVTLLRTYNQNKRRPFCLLSPSQQNATSDWWQAAEKQLANDREHARAMFTQLDLA